jgi:hypothetical protein|tara:strand:+ start:909 stop:1400 length:492 start_codon:yes stop_codon:yes gene_type:complete
MSIKGGVSQQDYLSVLGLTNIGETDITIGTSPIVMGNTTDTAEWETVLTSGPEFSVDTTTGLLTIPAGTYIINIFASMRTLTDERFVQLTFWDDTTELLESLTAMPYLDGAASYGNASIHTIMTLSGSDKYQIKLDNGSSGTSLIYLSNGTPATCGASFYKIA